MIDWCGVLGRIVLPRIIRIIVTTAWPILGRNSKKKSLLIQDKLVRNNST